MWMGMKCEHTIFHLNIYKSSKCEQNLGEWQKIYVIGEVETCFHVQR